MRLQPGEGSDVASSLGTDICQHRSLHPSSFSMLLSRPLLLHLSLSFHLSPPPLPLCIAASRSPSPSLSVLIISISRSLALIKMLFILLQVIKTPGHLGRYPPPPRVWDGVEGRVVGSYPLPALAGRGLEGGYRHTVLDIG